MPVCQRALTFYQSLQPGISHLGHLGHLGVTNSWFPPVLPHMEGAIRSMRRKLSGLQPSKPSCHEKPAYWSCALLLMLPIFDPASYLGMHLRTARANLHSHNGRKSTHRKPERSAEVNPLCRFWYAACEGTYLASRSGGCQCLLSASLGALGGYWGTLRDHWGAVCM